MKQLIELYKNTTGFVPDNIEKLNEAGSNRKYFRLHSKNNTPESVIGVIGTSADENKAFYNLAILFSNKNIRVPKVYSISNDYICYLQEDLGDISLFDFIKNGRIHSGNYDENEKNMIERVIRDLPHIQLQMNDSTVFQQCYPFKRMDRNSVMFDLNYFKYCYLKLNGLDFNEVKLQDDLDAMADDILNVNEYGFQYRDFQARNVLLKNDKPYYIDFQGGRCGPIYYDLVSFLWQASSRFSDKLRAYMVNAYLDELKKMRGVNVNEDDFKMKINVFVLFRTLQVLGAYGYRGLWEKKQHFIDSIPLALNNLSELINNGVCDNYNYLKQVAINLVSCKDEVIGEDHNSTLELIKNDKSYLKKGDKPLIVRVFSFSYKKGIPQDDSGNGGGYVFDCRSTHNPGRYEQYKHISGLDKPVIDFLEQDGEILKFLDSVYKLADFHVKRYIDRGFTNLMFAFGCTGGQHRSVYAAQHLAQHINRNFGVEVHIFHREQNIKQILK